MNGQPIPNPLLPTTPPDAAGRMRARYLDLLEAAISGRLIGDASAATWHRGTYDPARREFGEDWPSQALTMIGNRRLRNLRLCLEYVLANDVPGDFIETGVWRGGACLYAKGIFEAYEVPDRQVWVADSFAGLPKPNVDLYPADEKDTNYLYTQLAISQETVAGNFQNFGLLDDRVRFLKGWFSDTLPTAPIERIAVLRLDGDMYESTMDALNALYPKLQPGGLCIVDDYILPNCAAAIGDYRRAHGIDDPMVAIDGCGVYWQRSAPGTIAPLSDWQRLQDAAIKLLMDLRDRNEIAQAAALSQHAAADYPDNFGLLYLAAVLHRQIGDLPRARGYLLAAETQRLADPVLLITLADVLFEIGDHVELMHLCRRVGDYLEGNRDPVPLLQSMLLWNMARVQRVQGNEDAALNLARNALTIADAAPDTPAPWAHEIRGWFAAAKHRIA